MFTLILIVAILVGGMYLEKTYSPRLKIKDNKFGLAYNNKGKQEFKIFF